MSRLFKLNYKPAPQDSRDYIVKANIPNELPTTVDLSSYSTSVKSQGSIGSCTAFAGSALNEIICAKFDKPNLNFSEKFLYYATRVDVMKWPTNEDSGATVRDTLKAMNKFGICLESTFPYLREDEKECSFGDLPPPSAYDEAKNYLSTNYANIPIGNDMFKTLNSMKTLLQSGYPFMAGFNTYENFFDGQNGIIPESQGKIIGGHAVVFVGYDDQKSLLKFKNSWGPDWGDNGYGYLPYSFVLNRNVFDIWTVYNVSSEDKPFDVLIPTNRLVEYEDRMKDLTSKIINGISITDIQNYIYNDPRNNLLYPTDINTLLSYGMQFHMTYNHNKGIAERNRYEN
jgi:C1A family cysteine protease